MNKKYPCRFVAIFVSFILIGLMFGCRTTLSYTDMSGQSPYNKLVGNHYVVLKDFYLVRMLGDSAPSLYLCGENGLPQELDKNKIGNIINGVEIVGIVPKNTEFTFMKIIKYNLDSHIHIVILIPIVSLSSQFNNVEASVLKKRFTESYDFSFDSDLVEEVKPASK